MIKVKAILAEARSIQEEINSFPGVSRPKAGYILPELEQVVTDKKLFETVAKLFQDGHHAKAVQQAFVYLNNLVKRQTRNTADGAKLMNAVFSPNNPTLTLNALSNQSEIDEQTGYMQIMAGVMTGIRNPRVHEHDWEDTEERALQLLSLANHLVIRVKACKSSKTASTT